MVARTDDLDQARATMGRSLAWHGHLFAAGESEAAGDIVNAVLLSSTVGVSATAPRRSWRQHRHVGRPQQGRGAGQSGHSADDEGKLAEALATYEAVYRTFEAMGRSSRWQRC